ncbi:MAG TPA: WecB/TagA/CpsF family glycosyltransferase [Longimicrobiales bacterium]|nr:WecB/TagA/CpsF family glycosyltransferase [Longimicrobiales bacterium]
MSSIPELRRSRVLGVRFVAEPLDVVRRAVRRTLESDQRHAAYLCHTGAHGVVEANRDPRLRAILNKADFNVPDGKPIVLASRALGYEHSERAFGPDIMWAILEDSADLGLRHFFYGGKEGVADRLADHFTERIPGIMVSGTYCPAFRPLTVAEEEDVANAINAGVTDVVWVGLSTPKQERWIASMRHRLNVKLICSVGAAFDYHTGTIKPAPAWMQKAALEWLYRLVQEPGRLWRRYLEVVPRFLYLITLQLTGLRSFPEED